MVTATVQIDRLIQCIVQAVHPLKIILFGSAARDEMTPDSDLDLLVVMPEGTHRRHTAQYLYRMIEGVTIPFDLIVATPADLAKYGHKPGLVYQQVLQEGKVVSAA